MENRIQLTLMGLSYNPLQNGAFALLLSAKESDKRIPIIIGAPEAQAIAMVIEGINPQRPMTHDLFASFAGAFGIELTEVFIYKFEDGIFYSEMTFDDGDRRVTLDSRTSDAIAVAIRVGAKIYTTPAILEETGIEITETESVASVSAQDAEVETPVADYDSMSNEELNEELEAAIARDDFETAADIRRLLDDRADDDLPY
ncbi:MAG: bifunctional nuclease family protein [Bacteroidales bacterium]|nr:bifunctional nuclease family protein [Bacteroidales bacterium]